MDRTPLSPRHLKDYVDGRLPPDEFRAVHRAVTRAPHLLRPVYEARHRARALRFRWGLGGLLLIGGLVALGLTARERDPLPSSTADRALALYRAGDHAAAEPLLAEGAQRALTHPHDSDYFLAYALANVRLERGDLQGADRALELCTRLVAHHEAQGVAPSVPWRVGLLLRRARLALLGGRPDDVAALWARADALAPEAPDPHRDQVAVYQAQFGLWHAFQVGAGPEALRALAESLVTASEGVGRTTEGMDRPEVDGRDTAARALLASWMVHGRTEDLARARALAEANRRHAGTRKNVRLEAWRHETDGLLLLAEAPPEDRLRLEEALSALRAARTAHAAAGGDRQLGSATRHLAIASARLGMTAEAVALFDEAERLTAEIPDEVVATLLGRQATVGLSPVEEQRLVRVLDGAGVSWLAREVARRARSSPGAAARTATGLLPAQFTRDFRL